jgi:hypothetical protein
MTGTTLDNIPEEIVLYAILPLLQCHELDVFSVTSKQNRKRVKKVMYPLFKQRLDKCLLGYVPDLTMKDILEANRQLYDPRNEIGTEPCISGKILTEVYLGRKVNRGVRHYNDRNHHLCILYLSEQPYMKHETEWESNGRESLSFDNHIHEFISTNRDIHQTSRGRINIGNGWRYHVSLMTWVAKQRTSNRNIFIQSEVRFDVPGYRDNLMYLDNEQYYDIRVSPFIYCSTLVVPGWIKSLYFPSSLS